MNCLTCLEIEYRNYWQEEIRNDLRNYTMPKRYLGVWYIREGLLLSVDQLPMKINSLEKVGLDRVDDIDEVLYPCQPLTADDIVYELDKRRLIDWEKEHLSIGGKSEFLIGYLEDEIENYFHWNISILQEWCNKPLADFIKSLEVKCY